MLVDQGEQRLRWGVAMHPRGSECLVSEYQPDSRHGANGGRIMLPRALWITTSPGHSVGDVT